MNTSRFSWISLLFAICLAAPQTTRAHSAAEEMAQAAQNLLFALGPDQKAKCTFEFKNDERFNWHFIPKPRKGLTLQEMTPAQRHLAYGLLNSGLSQRGFMKATTIMSLEQILLEMEKGSGPKRDPEIYYVSIFGEPKAGAVWGWRVEGHHLSLNFAIAPDQSVAVTPSFLGTNPADVKTGPRTGLRVLAQEEDSARKLVQSLSAEQKQTAVYTNKAPADIITAADRKARLLDPAGLAVSKMDKAQAEMLTQVVREYVYRYRSELADKDLAKIEAAPKDKIFFAWAGGLDRGQPHYYRVQGPSFLIEFDNTQNNANHVHAVWRDLQNDFGEDILARHYEQTPHAK